MTQIEFETIKEDGNTFYKVVGTTTERNFEDDVERLMHEAGWITFESNIAAQADYDRKLALKVDSLVGFVKQTQPKEWAKIEKQYGAHAKERFLKRVTDELEPHDDRGGVIAVLRRGIKMAPGAHFRLCAFKPASDKNPEAVENYKANRFELVRQLRFGTLPDDANDSVDVALFLNGIPVVTMELKNNLSGQRTAHAVEQYKRDRSPKDLLFKPNRRGLSLTAALWFTSHWIPRRFRCARGSPTASRSSCPSTWATAKTAPATRPTRTDIAPSTCTRRSWRRILCWTSCSASCVWITTPTPMP